jgi:uncharacterized protein YqhQ
LGKKTYYGGQAVMEGVMMRGARTMAVAVRKPNGEITTDLRPLPSLYTGWARHTPIIRGIIVLIESLVLGMQTLMFSANIAMEGLGEPGEKEEEGGAWMWVIVLIGVGIAIALFFLAPLFITRLFGIGNSIVFNIVDGVIRLVFFILYLVAVGLMPSIRRVFAYHGAEHMTVNAYENNVPLEVASVRKFSTAHIRCGTAFLFIVMVIAILVFALVGKPALWLMILARIVLIPLIAAFAYEVTYFAGRHAQNPFVRAILAPGLWLQSLTTRKPDDSMLEVGIAALKKVLEAEQEPPAADSTTESSPAV